MAGFKPHKTVEQIAKKHRLDVSFIQKQLDMGEPIEHEHTKDHQLSRYIALQHLDEIPDYYTRLKKMETSAKKQHKKFKDVKESINNEEMRYCPLCDKRETRSECSYGEKAWDKVSVKDEEYSMARSEIKTIEDAVKRLKNTVGKGEGNLEAWVQSKITKAADYIDTAADYVSSGEHSVEENVKITVRRGVLHPKDTQLKRSTGAGALSPEAAEELGGKAVELRKKKLAQTELPKIKKEEKIVDKILQEIEEGSCWKSTEKKNKKENEVVQEATRLQSETGNIISVTVSWRGKYYSIKMFFPQTKIPNRKEIEFELQKIYPDSKVIQHSVSDIQPGQPLIKVSGSYAKPGPNRNYVKPMGEEVEIAEEKK